MPWTKWPLEVIENILFAGVLRVEHSFVGIHSSVKQYHMQISHDNHCDFIATRLVMWGTHVGSP